MAPAIPWKSAGVGEGGVREIVPQPAIATAISASVSAGRRPRTRRTGGRRSGDIGPSVHADRSKRAGWCPHGSHPTSCEPSRTPEGAIPSSVAPRWHPTCTLVRYGAWIVLHVNRGGTTQPASAPGLGAWRLGGATAYRPRRRARRVRPQARRVREAAP